MRIVRSCERVLGTIVIQCLLTPQQQQRTDQAIEERSVAANVVAHRFYVRINRLPTARQNLAALAGALRAMADWMGNTAMRDAGIWMAKSLFPQFLDTRPPPPPPSIPEHYQTLQLLPGCSMEVAEAAYRALVKKHHPDVGGSVDTMQRINAAMDRIRSERN